MKVINTHFSAQPDALAGPSASTPCGRAVTTPPSSPVTNSAALPGLQPASSSHAPAPVVAAPSTFGVEFSTLHQSFAPPPTGTAGVSDATQPDVAVTGDPKDVPPGRWMTPNARRKYERLLARRKTDPLPAAPAPNLGIMKRKQYEICKGTIEAREFNIDRLEKDARARGRTPASDEVDESLSEADGPPTLPALRKPRKDYTQTPAQPSPRKTRRTSKRNRSPSASESHTPSRASKRRLATSPGRSDSEIEPPALGRQRGQGKRSPPSDSDQEKTDSDQEKTDGDQEKSDNSRARQHRRLVKGKGKAVIAKETDTEEEGEDSDSESIVPAAPRPAGSSASSESGSPPPPPKRTVMRRVPPTTEQKSRREQPRSGKAVRPPNFSRLPKYWRIAIEIILSICANGPCDPRTVAEKAFLLMLPLERPGEYSRTSGVSNLGPLTPIQQSIYNIARSQDLLLSRQLQLFVDTAAFMEQYRLERVKQQGSGAAATSGEHIAQLQASFAMALPGVVHSDIKPEPLIEQVMQLDKVPEKKQENTLTSLNFLGANYHDKYHNYL